MRADNSMESNAEIRRVSGLATNSRILDHRVLVGFELKGSCNRGGVVGVDGNVIVAWGNRENGNPMVAW